MILDCMDSPVYLFVLAPGESLTCKLIASNYILPTMASKSAAIGFDKQSPKMSVKLGRNLLCLVGLSSGVMEQL